MGKDPKYGATGERVVMGGIAAYDALLDEYQIGTVRTLALSYVEAMLVRHEIALGTNQPLAMVPEVLDASGKTVH